MSILQIHFENRDQWQMVVAFFRQLKLDFKVIQSDDFVEKALLEEPHELYLASLLVLSEDWDDPANDYWDNL
jgi:hypothetical protein